MVDIYATAFNILALGVYEQTNTVCKCGIGNLDVLDACTIVVNVCDSIATDLFKDTIVSNEVLNNVGGTYAEHTTLVANVTRLK